MAEDAVWRVSEVSARFLEFAAIAVSPTGPNARPSTLPSDGMDVHASQSSRPKPFTTVGLWRRLEASLVPASLP